MSLLGLYKVEDFWFYQVIYVTAIVILEGKKEKKSFNERGMAVCTKSEYAPSKEEIKEDRKPLILG